MFSKQIADIDAPPSRKAPHPVKPLESEALAMLRLFLVPILEQADTWADLSRQLAEKGFGLSFRRGHLVIQNDRNEALCTGRDLGVPLAVLSARIGRPCVRAHRTGETGDLAVDKDNHNG